MPRQNARKRSLLRVLLLAEIFGLMMLAVQYTNPAGAQEGIASSVQSAVESARSQVMRNIRERREARVRMHSRQHHSGL
jgi:hypothetical protein